jgi:hypothetical protein
VITQNRDENFREIETLMHLSEEMRARRYDTAAAELLWGAFANGLIAIAQANDWPHSRHGDLKSAAPILTGKVGTRDWRAQFGQAERLHTNFYRRIPRQALDQCFRSTGKAAQELLGEARRQQNGI